MKIQWARWIALTSLVLCLSCATRNSLLREHLKSLKSSEETVVVVFGDSFSCGTDATGIGSSYGAYLKPMLAGLLGSSVSLINTSKEEESYRFAHRRIQEDILSFRPDIVLVMLGLYDFMAQGVLMATHRRNIDKFYSILKKYDAFVVVLTTPGPRNLLFPKDQLALKLEEINDLIRDYARFYHYPVIDVARYMEKLMMDDPEAYRSLFDTQVTFNEKGKKVIADFIYSRLLKILGTGS